MVSPVYGVIEDRSFPCSWFHRHQYDAVRLSGKVRSRKGMCDSLVMAFAQYREWCLRGLRVRWEVVHVLRSRLEEYHGP